MVWQDVYIDTALMGPQLTKYHSPTLQPAQQNQEGRMEDAVTASCRSIQSRDPPNLGCESVLIGKYMASETEVSES